MDIKEVLTLKENLENEIKDKLNIFIDKTGLKIEDVTMQIAETGEGNMVIIDLKLDVRL